MLKELNKQVNMLHSNMKETLVAFKDRRINKDEVLKQLVDDIDRFHLGLFDKGYFDKEVSK